MFDALPVTDRGALGIAALIYGAAFTYGLISILVRKRYSHASTFALLCGGFAIQTLGLNIRGLEVRGCPLGNFFEISQFICWSIVLLYFIVGPVFRLRLLGFFTAALATCISGISLLIPAWDQSYPPGIFGGNPWIELHAALAIFSYGVFAIVALVSVMFLIQQHGLKTKQFKGIYQFLPSVQQLDTMGKRLLVTGEICLSAALAFGAVFWVNNSELVPVFKLAMTCLVWLGYLIVIILQVQGKLVTKRHAIASILLFIFALLSLWPVQSASAANHPSAAQSSDPAE
ncbi:cytochrome C assembly family protein [Coraliomargarita akajimensis]|uniref:Cytochrome c assembly protein n=1 Tax=Coraliomargarita akajimensis (strain DSM 45221 / IAM 15411 / JCM 23193 / KCTC 12865 / 04OKA010-24) TaxID=583355 RepID=D5ENF6_CORAD|nr:cytochrome c biogenesis protein CcsA [Coraliomargarita akajimensis]ADE55432.1 cytochrome c assembly protein [Coraliomargarita akajimensis DSM 45221]